MLRWALPPRMSEHLSSGVGLQALAWGRRAPVLSQEEAPPCSLPPCSRQRTSGATRSWERQKSSSNAAQNASSVSVADGAGLRSQQAGKPAPERLRGPHPLPSPTGEGRGGVGAAERQGIGVALPFGVRLFPDGDDPDVPAVMPLRLGADEVECHRGGQPCTCCARPSDLLPAKMICPPERTGFLI
jgi:hypothetical protein